MSVLTRDETAQPVELSGANGDSGILFPCSAYDEQDWLCGFVSSRYSIYFCPGFLRPSLMDLELEL